MKKRLLILGIMCGLMLTTRAEQVVAARADSVNHLDTLVVMDSVETTMKLIIDDMARVTVHQDSAITQLMLDKRLGYVRGEQIKEGFRVQIYASNRQQLAKKEASELQLRIEALIDVPVYTISEPPFWKVRIGNFETRDSANEYKNTFLQLFPELTGSTYVVPDKIIIIR
ncbi:MAG: SPOR domain-containing protein [Paludibacteraceae bacterium]|nr:SPOR domain-containing protein [Paludibacteraceae bacterium]